MSGTRIGTLSGATQQMLPPGQAWFDPRTGNPTTEAWQFFFALFARTGGASAPVSAVVPGQIGLTAVAAQAAQAQTLAAEAQTLGLLDLFRVPDVASAVSSSIGDDALALALVPQDAQQSTTDSFAVLPLLESMIDPALWTAGRVKALGDGLSLTAGKLSAPGSGAIYAPLVSGETPGPVLMALPNGACVMVRVA